MEISTFPTSESASIYVAECIAENMRAKAVENSHLVLGLATGSSPLLLYKELVRMHKEEDLNFENVITFNLDEYYPMPKKSAKSYYAFMHNQLFNHVNIKPQNIHLFDGTFPASKIDSFCDTYDQKIIEAGGIDFQILGIGRTGHIGFNEPGSSEDSCTRLVDLNEITRKDAASDFGDLQKVPSKAITMGIESILKANKIYLLAWGAEKAEVIRKCFLEEVTSKLPASYLQEQRNVELILDPAAAKLIQSNLIEN
ncbi:MAG: glucosamine-6-phosphate deaminase [Balneolaceae bacterium]